MAGLPDIPLQFPNIGNALATGAHAGYYMQEARQKADEEQRRQAAMPSMEAAAKGDPAAMAAVATGAPKEAVALSTMLSRLDANKRADVKAAAEYTAHAANAVLQADPKDRAAVYRQVLELGRAQGHDVSRLPADYTPQLDPMLRSHRAMSTEILKLDESQKNRDVRLQIHNSPVSGSGGALTPMDTPTSAPPAAAPRPVAPGRPVSALMPGEPGAPPPTNVAAAPPMAGTEPVAQGDGTYLSAPPDLKEPPKQPARSGTLLLEDPEPFGYKRLQDPKHPGMHHLDDKGFLHYQDPATGQQYRYKPREEKPHGPQGPFAGNSPEMQFSNLLHTGDPSTPEYAQAYAHIGAERVVQDPQSGQITRIKPDMSWARPPTFALPGAAGPAPGAAPAPAPGAKTVAVEQGRGKPLDNAARDDLAKTGGVLELSELVKSFDPSFGGYAVDQLGEAANFAKRNLPDWAGGADPKGQAQWWQRYQAMSNIERNKLFGSALTPGEAAAWKAATITPGMKPDQITANIQRQSEIAQKALSRLVNGMVKSGYNQEAVEAATGIRLSDLPSPIGGVPQAAPSGAAPPSSGGRPPLSSFQR